MSYPVETILVRRDPVGDPYDRVRVVGSERSSMSITPADAFGEVRPLTSAQATVEYGVEILAEGGVMNAPTLTPVEPSPEEVLRQQRRDEPVTGPQRSAWRPKQGDDPRTLLEGSRTDTGVPSVVALNDSPVQPPSEPVAPAVTTTPVEDVEKTAPPKRGGTRKKA